MDTPPRILVVDDMPEAREIVTSHLQRQGSDIAIAVGGEDSLQKLRAVQNDLVLLDIRTRKLSGMAVEESFAQSYRGSGQPAG